MPSRAQTRPSAALEDRPGDIADRFDLLVHALETDDTARARLEAITAPGKRADHRALVEHLLDIAADILGVDQSLLEGVGVKWKHVLGAVLGFDIRRPAPKLPGIGRLGMTAGLQLLLPIHMTIGGAARPTRCSVYEARRVACPGSYVTSLINPRDIVRIREMASGHY